MPAIPLGLAALRASVVEIGRGFVVNKSDLPGADKTIHRLRDTLEDDRPVWPVSSLRGQGLEPLCDWIEQSVRRP